MSTRSALLIFPLLLLCADVASGQYYGVPPYTRPDEPTRAELDRLNLHMAWSVYLPVGGVQDGIAIVQWLDDQVFVQTRSGRLTVLDARTGRLQWRFEPEHPYTNVFPVAVNAKYVFLVNGTRLYSYDRYQGTREFRYNMLRAPSAGPYAEPDRVYVCLGNSLLVNYALPNPVPTLRQLDDAGRPRGTDSPLTPDGGIYSGQEEESPSLQYVPPVQLAEQVTGGFLGDNKTPSITVLPTLRPPYSLEVGSRTPSVAVLSTLRPPYSLPDGSISPSVVALPPSVARAVMLNDLVPRGLEPTLVWEYSAAVRIHSTPLVTIDRVLVPTTSGFAFALDKIETRPLYDTEFAGQIAAPLVQAEEIAYIPTDISYLYALDIPSGRIKWRYSSGSPLTYGTVVTTHSVFASGARAGIFHVDRETGVEVWRNTQATRVHAINPKFVYATDEHGRLHIIDRLRGYSLTSWDMSGFNVPVVNDQTDRLLLAANNGLLVCLHDKDFVQPQPIYVPPPPEKQVNPEDLPDPMANPADPGGLPMFQ